MRERRRKRSLAGTGETELEVLQVVWELGEATVGEVLERLLKRRTVAYTTVMTVMRNLADKGYLSFEVDGRTYRYRPAVPPEDVKHGFLKGVMDHVFGGSPAALVQNLVRQEPLSREERDAIRHLIDEMDHDER